MPNNNKESEGCWVENNTFLELSRFETIPSNSHMIVTMMKCKWGPCVSHLLPDTETYSWLTPNLFISGVPLSRKRTTDPPTSCRVSVLQQTRNQQWWEWRISVIGINITHNFHYHTLWTGIRISFSMLNIQGPATILIRWVHSLLPCSPFSLYTWPYKYARMAVELQYKHGRKHPSMLRACCSSGY